MRAIFRLVRQHYTLLIICGLLFGSAVALILGRPDLLTRALIVIIPALMAIAFLIRNKSTGTRLETIVVDKKILISLYFIFFTLSIVSLYLTPYRTIFYFIAVSAMVSIISLQIISRDFSPVIILIQMIMLMMNMIFSVTLNYPMFFGGTDVLQHILLIRILLETGAPVTETIYPSYSFYPLFHILMAQAVETMGTGVYFSMSFVSGIAFSTMLLIIFKLFQNLSTGDDRISLLACLLYSISTIVIYYGQYSSITRVFAFFGFLYILYFIYCRSEHPLIRTRKALLCLVFLTFTLLVHQVSAFQMLIVLALLMIAQYVSESRRSLKPGFFILLGVSFASYLSYISSTFFSKLFGSRLDQLGIISPKSVPPPQNGDTPPQNGDDTTSEFEEYVDNSYGIRDSIQPGNEFIFLRENIDTGVFTLLIFLGIGALIRLHNQRNLVMIGAFGLVALLFYIPNPLWLNDFMMSSLRIDRIALLVAPIFALIMAYGFSLLTGTAVMKNPRNLVILVVSLVFTASFFSMVGINARDAQDINPNQIRWHFEADEVLSISFVEENIDYGSRVFSDNNIGRALFSQTNPHIPYYKVIVLSDDELAPGYYLIRDQKFSIVDLDTNLSKSNNIFSNGDVNIYINK